jgi:hypothetical protein
LTLRRAGFAAFFFAGALVWVFVLAFALRAGTRLDFVLAIIDSVYF